MPLSSKRIVTFSSAAVAVALSLMTQARAELGGHVRTIEQDRINLACERSAPDVRSKFTVHTLTNKRKKLTVRQYVGKDDKVFAVTWRGKRHPDLRLLLGRHYDEYAKASVKAGRGIGRAPYRPIEGTGIRVVKAGRGALHGKAYALPLPTGIQANEIK